MAVTQKSILKIKLIFRIVIVIVAARFLCSAETDKASTLTLHASNKMLSPHTHMGGNNRKNERKGEMGQGDRRSEKCGERKKVFSLPNQIRETAPEATRDATGL